MTLHDFLKGAKLNTELEINGYDSFTYKDYKKDLDGIIGNSNVLSFDADDYFCGDGTKVKSVSVSINDISIKIKSAYKERIESYIDVLNDLIGENKTEVVEFLIAKVEKLLPSNVWLNFDGLQYWVLRYKNNDNFYYFPIELI